MITSNRVKYSTITISGVRVILIDSITDDKATGIAIPLTKELTMDIKKSLSKEYVVLVRKLEYNHLISCVNMNCLSIKCSGCILGKPDIETEIVNTIKTTDIDKLHFIIEATQNIKE